ncbi:hypothetical protein M9H77_31140 [Catharanthus roseus]|uniref:Uncharacterized protein n=1 Tax=Catharanthus roseus TaxID=4058 RepID=A0ACB9ZZ71_CATRO|nr:hypothetical protein M9H77_31140 [Catharanthus roseus]
MGNSKGKKEMYIFSQGIEKEESIKPSLLEKSSMVNELQQARIELDESVEMHVKGEMSKEDFGDSRSDLSFEEEEIIEFERKDRCEKDESSKEEENDVEENKRTKEMSEEKQENSKEELDIIELRIEGAWGKSLALFLKTYQPFKELFYLCNSYGVVTLIEKLNALFAYSLLSLECLDNFPSIVPLNASISNVARLLLLFEGMDSRMNPFKEGVDDMTQRAQGSRAIARFSHRSHG